MATNENLRPDIIKRLAKELKNLDETPPEGIKVVVDDGDFLTIHADIDGPVGTPYENGVFRMKLILSNGFPKYPPKGYFMTNIFHPNISTTGEICVNTLQKDWNENLGLRHVLTVVRCLLIEPFPESALNERAAKLLLEDYEEYARHARLLTGIHAKPKPKFKSGAITESTTALNVDQTNTSVLNADSKTVPSNAALPPLSMPSITAARGASQDQAVGILTESSVNCSTASAVVSAAPAPQKKEIRTAKAQADKKKLDARKKSLKRL